MSLLFTEKGDWDGRAFTVNLYTADEFADPFPIKQVQAVCFNQANKVVLYKHTKGFIGLPGGHMNEGEDLSETLRREIVEEVSCEMNSYKLIAWEKVFWDHIPDKIHYHARAIAIVKENEWQPDPDGKAIERLIVPFDEAKTLLGYGEKGKILLDLAYNNL